MGVAAVGFMGLFRLMIVLDGMSAENYWEMRVFHCAQEKMEELKFQAADKNVTSLEGCDSPAMESQLEMERWWHIGPSSLVEGLKEISVTCSCTFKGEKTTKTLQALAFTEG